jgi:predicted transcriptional regulator
MPRPAPATPTELELLILKVLWRAEDDGDVPLAVREIRDRLAEGGRDLAHTSVVTMLNIMAGKRLAKRYKRKNVLYFSPRVSRECVHRSTVSDLLDRVFDGSAEKLMVALLDSSDVNAKQIAEVKKIISRKEREGRQ